MEERDGTAPKEPDFENMTFEQRRDWARIQAQVAMKPSAKPPLDEMPMEMPEIVQVSVDELSARTRTNRDKGSDAARFRAQRAHMMRKLKSKFDLYRPFLPEDAAKSCKVALIDVKAYLEFESSLPGSLIESINDDKYIIISAFV